MTDEQLPLVSIIVPSYNQGRFIAKTIASVLEQDYPAIELIVVDGASKDETLDVLRSYDGHTGLRWVSEPDDGVVDAVNKGLAMATGPLAAIQSSDDYYCPGAVRAAVDVLLARPELGFVVGDIVQEDAEGTELDRTHLADITLENLLALRTWIPQPSTFFRLDLARRLGGWREEVPYAADTDLWLRMAFEAPAAKLDRILAVRTQHEDQRAHQGERIVRDYGRMLDELTPLHEGPARLRRAARAGRLRNRHRYRPPRNWVQGWWAQVCIAASHPPLVRDIGLLTLVPGLAPLRARLAALRGRSPQP